MKPFKFINSINIDTIANKFSLYNDWHNPYSMMRQASYFVHQDTDTIPLMWSLESLKNSPAHEQAPKTEYWEKYFDQSFFDELFNIINSYKKGYPVRILFALLRPAGWIGPHTDSGESLRINSRIHLPIITNEQVFFSVGGETIYMKPGEIFEINNQLEHEVANDSSEDRIHLVIDWHGE